MATTTSVRLSLDVSQPVNALLEEVADHNGASKSEVLRRAIALIAYADEVKRRGQSLAVTDKNRNIVAEVVNPW